MRSVAGRHGAGEIQKEERVRSNHVNIHSRVSSLVSNSRFASGYLVGGDILILSPFL